MKIFSKLNKNIKFMILSATIDEDENEFGLFFEQLNKIRIHTTL